MRASTLLMRTGTPSDGASPGLAALQRAGYLAELGPGIVGGGGLLAAVLQRLADRLLARLSLPMACLPVSDGGALVNLLLQHGGGRESGPRGAALRSAGFRPDGDPAKGLHELQLYERIDAATVSAVDALAGDRSPAELLAGELLTLGLTDLAQQSSEPGETLWLDPVAPGGPAELLRCTVRSLGPDPDGTRVSLASLDLHATLGSLAERHHDPRGLRWPAALAPFDVALLAVVPEGAGLLEKLQAELLAGGVRCLLDDRGRPAAVAREELLAAGLPRLLMAGPNWAEGEVLLADRDGSPPRRLSASDAMAQLLPGRSALRRALI